MMILYFSFTQVIRGAGLAKISGNNLTGIAELDDFTMSLKWSNIGKLRLHLIQVLLVLQYSLQSKFIRFCFQWLKCSYAACTAFYLDSSSNCFLAVCECNPRNRIPFTDHSRVRPTKCWTNLPKLKNYSLWWCTVHIMKQSWPAFDSPHMIYCLFGMPMGLK